MAIWTNIKRAFSQKSTSAQLAQLMAFARSSKSGVAVTPDSALQCATVYACIRVLSESLAQLPLHVMRQRDQRIERAVDHRLYSVFRWQPNPYQTAFEFIEYMAASLYLRGNAYARIIRVGDTVELLPLHPSSVKPSIVDGKPSYKVKLTPSGSYNDFPADQILHVRGFSSDGITGMSPIEQARECIGLAMAAEGFGARLFSNNAQPGGVLEVPHKITAEYADELREMLAEASSGDNVMKPLVLQEGLKWTRMGLSSDDAQFLETRKFQAIEICGIYGVPPHKLAIVDKAFTSIEHQNIEFWKGRVLPDAIRFEQAFNRALLDVSERGEYSIKFNFDGVLRGDTLSRYQAHQMGVMSCILAPNEARAMEGLNPIPGLDTPLRPLNMEFTNNGN